MSKCPWLGKDTEHQIALDGSMNVLVSFLMSRLAPVFECVCVNVDIKAAQCGKRNWHYNYLCYIYCMLCICSFMLLPSSICEEINHCRIKGVIFIVEYK